MLKNNNFPAGPIALDCEMVGVGNNKRSALARVSIVDYTGRVIYDVISRPDEPITDFRTRYSGIRPIDMEDALSFERVQTDVKKIIERQEMMLLEFFHQPAQSLPLNKPVTDYRTQFSGIRPEDLVNALPLKVVRQKVIRIIKNRIVVGHAIWNDFEVLRLSHPHYLIRDTCTAPYPRVRLGRGKRGLVALRDLYFEFFGKEIQQNEHSSVEDARATMEIYRQVEKEWEADLKGNDLESNTGGSRNEIFSKRKKSSKSSGLQMLRDSTFPAGPIALDCEMVGVGEKMESALARATIVAYDGTVLYDVICKPVEVITDYRTKYSGIRPKDMVRAIPFSAVQDQVKRIIEDRIVVGHALSHDFAVLDLRHPRELIRDTSKAPYAKTKALMKGNASVSLKRLSAILLGIQIQVGEHNSAEDARANMEIYKLVEKEWEAGIKESSSKRGAKRRNEAIVSRPKENINPLPQDIPDSELLTCDAIWEPQKCDSML
ncbi:unnamed protein product [Rodentolepis nana]|uniref:RNA exonuclease 4 n=1 Tax=Rodentolepis nana TaxID=102285 RepID=A0A3P7SC89_RODNA|nr:unnamed protein product [Rodentolepis nana]